MSAVAMASYNNLSVTAALPDIGDDLGRVALLPWVVTVELVAAAIAVLAVGPYIDGAGARRAFRITVVAFLADLNDVRGRAHHGAAGRSPGASGTG